jgi:hypothetical protein
MAQSVAFDSGFFSLTSEEARMLSTITEVLSPEPANACSCVASLDRKLSGPLSRLLPAFRQGLAATDITCRQQTGCCLADLEAGERRRFIGGLRSGHKLTAFFGLLSGTCLAP